MIGTEEVDSTSFLIDDSWDGSKRLLPCESRQRWIHNVLLKKSIPFRARCFRRAKDPKKEDWFLMWDNVIWWHMSKQRRRSQIWNPSNTKSVLIEVDSSIAWFTQEKIVQPREEYHFQVQAIPVSTSCCRSYLGRPRLLSCCELSKVSPAGFARIRCRHPTAAATACTDSPELPLFACQSALLSQEILE